ncbi:uncharacterized protein isoform X3 [Rhodnius prolixus]|uniref:uncharacterized protein isoform X3 n=1 Tax=Rhodnius prolixus TaxID=13249 RepID=UPI003D18D8EB
MQVMGPWFGWCSDCFKNCCDDKNAESDHLFVTSFVQQPVKTVRRISSVGQTLTNEDGEEIEMPRHSSILQSYNGVPIPWSSNPITVQPGVSRYELETRLKTLPTISEMPNILPIPKETRSWKLPLSNAKKKEYSLSRCTDKSTAGDIPLIRYTANTQNLGEEDVFSQKVCLKLNQHNFREEKQPRLHKGSCSSSPNLISLEQAAESQSSNYSASSLTNVSIHSNLAKSMTWLHSQSLEDVNDKQMEAERLARQYGLDLSLYRNASLLDSSDVVQVDNPSDLMVEEPTGFVEFSIYFNTSLNLLSIFVSKVGGLSGSGCNKLPYSVLLKVCAFSNKNIVKTSKKTVPSLNPVINQSFTFILKDRKNKIVRMSVYNSDFLGKFDAIGHSLVSLQEFECNKNYRMKLYKRTLVDACTGMMQLACHNVGDRFYIKINKVLSLLPKYICQGRVKRRYRQWLSILAILT